MMQAGDLITDPEQVANILASHFESVSSNNSYSQQFLLIKQTSELNELNFSTKTDLMYNSPITLREVKGVLKQCKKTAPGQDQITCEMIRNSNANSLVYLKDIYNQIWSNNSYPSQWHCAIILPFAKPNKPVTDASGYRPIGLTSCIGKLLEKITNIRLMNYL